MVSYIKENRMVRETEAAALIQSYMHSGTLVYAVYTDRFYCGLDVDLSNLHHLLELRVFDENVEMRLRRCDLYGDFQMRVIDDTVFADRLKDETDEFLRRFENRVFTEVQYLDRDLERMKVSGGTDYITTGGGHYSMPFPDADRVVLRNYLDYDEETGILRVTDFRLVGFKKEDDT